MAGFPWLNERDYTDPKMDLADIRKTKRSVNFKVLEKVDSGEGYNGLESHRG